jgi:hypothetical protein
MSERKSSDVEALLGPIRDQAKRKALRITQHAQQEMAEEDISLEEALEAIRTGRLIEDYPEHRRGPCCLICGYTGQQRPLHIVCTTTRPLLILITVYEPKPPKWITPTQRGTKL